MYRLMARALKTMLVICVVGVIGIGACTAQVPDPDTGLRPDGTQAFVPDEKTPDAENDVLVGGTVIAEDGTELEAIVDTFAADVHPDYYRVIGVSTSDDETLADGITYGELDGLGRTTGAAGWITGEMRIHARERGRSDAELPDPAGWPDDNAEVEIAGARGRHDYHGWFWNRSHLIADSLGGEPVAENLVAGTRTQNVGDNATPGGMSYTETLARDWLDAHPDGRLWYAAIPVYVGDELIPRAVIVDIKSDDAAIDQKVVVYNRANGWDIDYATGKITPADITYR